MLMPSIFGETLLDGFWGFPTRENFGRSSNTNGLMQSDITETDHSYEVTMNLPGFKKEDVKGELRDGYLIVSATTNSNNEETDREGRYIRRERYSGSCSRSFYVGENVKQEDIKARFEDGTLKLTIPRTMIEPAIDESRYIAIEG